MKKLTKLAAAVSLVLMAGNASAALVTPVSANGQTGLSDLLFSLEDTNADNASNYKHTFALDLGTTYQAILSGATALSWNLNSFTAFANFAADTASLRWSVLGGEQRTGSAATTTQTWGALATSHNGAADFPSLNGTTPGSVRAALANTGAIGAYYDSVNTKLGVNQAVDINPYTATSSLYTSKINNLGVLQDSTGLHTVGAGSNDLWRATLPGTAGSDLIQYSQLGSFSLSSGNILTYNALAAPSAVPVPAAVWLFGSALLGMLGFTRRDNAQGLAA